MSDNPMKACPFCGRIRRGNYPERWAGDICERCLAEGHRYRMMTARELTDSATNDVGLGYQITADRKFGFARKLKEQK